MTMKIDYEDSLGGIRPVSFTMTQPDDMHLHVRDGSAMEDVVGHSLRFSRAIIMPNLKPPITTAVQAWGNYEKIRAVAKKHESHFEPLMTLYLTDNTPPNEINRAKESGLVNAIKYYPAGATTNSDAGVTDIKKVFPVLERMQDLGMPLLLHGEVTDPSVDIFDREVVFIREVFTELRALFPGLKMVLEHITTRQGVQIVEAERVQGYPTAATITAHHLLLNRNSLFLGGMRPHNFCYPVLKSEENRQALLEAVKSGNEGFFLGTDSAPHPRGSKECDCVAGGCFTAYHALELYAEAFDSVGALDKLEGFASHHGADFYGLSRNLGTVTLVREEWKVRDELPFGASVVVPFRAGEMMQWKMK
jgi:dihydroorotase